MGLPFETDYGGTGTGTLMLNIAVEEAHACASSSLIPMVQISARSRSRGSARRSSARSGCPDARPASGRRVRARSPTGLGRLLMRTTAVRDSDHWVINGTKNWITNATIANFTRSSRSPTARRARARSSSRPTVRVQRAQARAQDGIRGSPTGQLLFEDVRVPAENLIGEEGRGWPWRSNARAHAARAAAQAVGIAQGAVDYAAQYARERIAFGKPINEPRASAYSPTWKRERPRRASCSTACAMADADDPGLGKYSSMAKLFHPTPRWP
jgi:acyl-CoA dehydrogenase